MKNLSTTSRRAMMAKVAKTAQSYQGATKKQKGVLLSRLTNGLGYDRNYLSWILTRYGKRRTVSKKGGRPRVYDESFIVALKTLWVEMNFPCGKRMATDRKKALENLESDGRITIDHQTRERLLKVSAAMIDRLLAPEKKARTLSVASIVAKPISP